MLMLLANQRPALKGIASARRQKYDAVCLLSENIATRPMRPFRPLRSSVLVPERSQVSFVIFNCLPLKVMKMMVW